MENINLVDVLLIPLATLSLWVGIVWFFWSKSKILAVLLFPFVPIVSVFISPSSLYTTLEFITLVVFGLSIILVIVSKILNNKYPSDPEKIDVHKYLELSIEGVKELCRLYKLRDKLWEDKRYIEDLDLKKRKDGKFDERSKVGEKANDTLKQIQDRLHDTYGEMAGICYMQEKYEVWYLFISLGRYMNTVMIICSILILIVSNYFLIVDQNEFLLKFLNEIYAGSNMRAFLNENFVMNLIPVGIFVLPLMLVVFLFGFIVMENAEEDNILMPSFIKKHEFLMKIIENHNNNSVKAINC